jgi:hypothetical protein
MLASAQNPPLLLGIFGAAILVFGFVAIGVLWVMVIKKAPKDGSDIGRDPRIQGDEHKRQNGAREHTRRP